MIYRVRVYRHAVAQRGLGSGQIPVRAGEIAAAFQRKPLRLRAVGAELRFVQAFGQVDHLLRHASQLGFQGMGEGCIQNDRIPAYHRVQAVRIAGAQVVFNRPSLSLPAFGGGAHQRALAAAWPALNQQDFGLLRARKQILKIPYKAAAGIAAGKITLRRHTVFLLKKWMVHCMRRVLLL